MHTILVPYFPSLEKNYDREDLLFFIKIKNESIYHSLLYKLN